MADDLVQQLIEASGATANRDVLRDILRTAAGPGRRRRRPPRPQDHRRRPQGDAGRLRHVRAAARTRRRSRSSARPAPAPTTRSTTRPRRLAQHLAEAGWFVITGAGPGIMQAGAEGAGPERAIGISIRLPFEEAAQRHPRRRRARGRDEVLLHPQADADQGVVGLRVPARRLRHPGRDLRAAHAPPDRARPPRHPSCCSTCPAAPTGRSWVEYLDAELVRRRARSRRRTTSSSSSPTTSTHAVAAIQRFWHSYHSIRWVGDRLVVRLRHAPTADEVADAQRALRRPPRGRHASSAPIRCPPRSPTATTSSCRAS